MRSIRYGYVPGAWHHTNQVLHNCRWPATLIVCSGNPLETTSQVELAYVQGRTVDLMNKHQRLWDK